MFFLPLVVDTGWAGYALLVAGQIVTDPCWSFYEIHEVSIRQTVTDNALRGRVNATIRFAGFAAMLAGAAAGGAVASAFGPRAALFVCAAIMTLVALLATVSPIARYRSSHRPAPSPVPV
jgi:MFS family permease